MDLLSHVSWAGAAAEALRRRDPSSSGSPVPAAMALGAAPDLGQLLPVAAWSLGQDDPLQVVRQFIAAQPGGEPAMPALVSLISHHLHCIGHSAVIAAVVAFVVWRLRGRSWIPLVGWWLHIAVDVPTHSSDFYAVPFLYPFTYWGFDGVAWTNPWVLAVNYAALAAAGVALLLTRRRYRRE